MFSVKAEEGSQKGPSPEPTSLFLLDWHILTITDRPISFVSERNRILKKKNLPKTVKSDFSAVKKPLGRLKLQSSNTNPEKRFFHADEGQSALQQRAYMCSSWESDLQIKILLKYKQGCLNS